MFPDEALLSCIIMLNAIVLVIDGGTAHIGRCCASRSACASADDFRFQVVYCQSLSPPYFLFLFLFRKKRKRGVHFRFAPPLRQSCQWQVFAGGGSTQRFLRADNDDRDRSLGSIGCRLPQEPHPPSESAPPDQREGYHRRACGPVVSKCALRDKKKAERPSSPRTPQLPSCKFLS